MKSYILRAPETDRKKIEVPTLLTDLTDYDDTIVTAKGVAGGGQIIEPFNAENTALATFSELVNTTGTTVITVGVAGLFLCIITARWIYSAAGAPNLARRVGYSINSAASFGDSLRKDNDSTGATEFDDQASFLVRLAAGDTIQPRVQELTGTSAEVTATIEIVKLAP